ncbi:MAG: PQQ-binding-like beta-propeller repeat protein [Cyclobacteriaceae bacterium]|nr:PQQ-binding-like beta-propeller repeat protein [Cyclobacteriaceae bacterium]
MKHLIFTIFLSFVTLILGISSCVKEDIEKDGDGVVVSLPYQWTTSLSTDDQLIDGSVRNDITYNGNVLLGSQHGEEIKMSMVSSIDGEVLWTWDDLFAQDKDFDFALSWQYGNLLALHSGNRFYTIDLENGNTIIKGFRIYYSLNTMAGIGNRYFIAGNFILNSNGNYIGNVYTGKFTEEEDEILLNPKYSLEYVDGNNITGYTGSATPFIDEGSGDTLLIYDYVDALPDWYGNIFVGLYNCTKSMHVYEKVSLMPKAYSYSSGSPLIYEGRGYFFPAKSITCINLITGERIWSKSFKEGASNSIIVENVLLSNNEDTYLYGIDPATGRELWKEKSSGTSSRMSYLNGVVYFTGGGDGLLHAVDVATGKHIWKLRSPDLDKNSGAWFARRVSVIPGENGKRGKVITSSYLSAFCYEAAR